ncbi:hypothetical protein [Streptomyces sp. NRRL B-3648]|uniref:hypothetical protein n=1 Tax=Streptomyces sp. NRRL B-3648 TaxID=1519493 RepID=UPI0006AFC978|nr:hypothetical protein [Streptomyces sp. NRRL B-3648]
MDLLDWHRGRLSSRRLAVLVRHLPQDSATLRELHGDAAEWSVGDYLLAAVVDQLAEANWMFATVNRDEDAEPLEYPKPVPRPGTDGGTTGADAAESPSAAPEPPARKPTATELAQFFS